MTSDKDLKTLIIEGIHERKGRGVTIIDLSNIETAAASQFIIAEGTNPNQTAAIAESIGEYVHKNSGVKPYNVEGENLGDWVVMAGMLLGVGSGLSSVWTYLKRFLREGERQQQEYEDRFR